VKLINRWAVLVRYREPYLRWAASLDEKAPLHAEGLDSHTSIYLVPENLSEDEESFPLKEWFAAIFEQELEDWWQDEALWPKKRDLATFKAWFEVSVQSIVIDLAEGPVRVEEL
jgi:hypothetical protein